MIIKIKINSPIVPKSFSRNNRLKKSTNADRGLCSKVVSKGVKLGIWFFVIESNLIHHPF